MEMKKPYDGEALLKALKKEGIEGGLETAKKVTVVMADFMRTSAQLSTEGVIGKFDDFAIPAYNYGEKKAIEALDKLEAELVSEAA